MSQKSNIPWGAVVKRWGTGPLIGLPTLVWAGLMLLVDYAAGEMFAIHGDAGKVLVVIGSGLVGAGGALYVAVAAYFTWQRRHRRLVTTGPYARVRHPLYAIWIFLIVPGLALIGRSWLLASVPVVMYVLARHLLRYEERELMRRFGRAYADYVARSGALLPRWPSEGGRAMPDGAESVSGRKGTSSRGNTDEASAAGRSLFEFGSHAETYNQWYETDLGRKHDRVQKADVRRLLPPARPGEMLLDVGCGTGHWSRFFVSLGYEVTGVDVAWDMVHVAREGVPTATFKVADARALPFDDASFGVLATMATLEFIPDPDAALGEMVRCLKPGGRLLVGTLNRVAPLNRRRVTEGREPYASARLWSPAELRARLAGWGPVRMLASPVDDHERARSPDPRKDGREYPAPLSGPFIVAEVRP